MFWFFGHTACRILAPNQRWNLHPLHWMVKCQPLDYQGSPLATLFLTPHSFIVPLPKDMHKFSEGIWS